MSGENARVEIRTNGEDGDFWLTAHLNGVVVGNLPVASITDANVKSSRIESMVREVYRRAYRDGFRACQSSVKEALGISK